MTCMIDPVIMSRYWGLLPLKGGPSIEPYTTLKRGPQKLYETLRAPLGQAKNPTESLQPDILKPQGLDGGLQASAKFELHG